jgi:hypothetical protein
MLDAPDGDPPLSFSPDARLRRGDELWELFFVCCLYSVDVKNLRRELI